MSGLFFGENSGCLLLGCPANETFQIGKSASFHSSAELGQLNVAELCRDVLHCRVCVAEGNLLKKLAVVKPILLIFLVFLHFAFTFC